VVSSSDDVTTTEKEISKRVGDRRDRVSKSFYTQHPWGRESVLDEYYFDLTSYALFRVAADLIPSDYGLRDRWVRNVGRCMYGESIRLGLIRRPVAVASVASGGVIPNPVVSLTDTIPTMLQILDLFNSTNYLSSYRIVGDEAAATAKTKKTATTTTTTQSNTNAFDSYDNEDLTSGQDVNFLLSLNRPTTLGASLQITGESSRFTPEWVGPMLMAMWEEELSVGSSGSSSSVRAQVEGYFVDETYRENPKDFFPEELLLQFTLKQK